MRLGDQDVKRVLERLSVAFPGWGASDRDGWSKVATVYRNGLDGLDAADVEWAVDDFIRISERPPRVALIRELAQAHAKRRYLNGQPTETPGGAGFLPDADFLARLESSGQPREALKAVYPRTIWPAGWAA